jgi:hypothetical protein
MSFSVHKDVVADTAAINQLFHRVVSTSTNSAGWIGNELVEIVAPSSVTYKSRIESLESVSDKIDKLQPSRYELQYDDMDEPKGDIGLIAEDVEKIFPEFVRYDQKGCITGVHYDRFVTVLIKELIELRQRVKVLETNRPIDVFDNMHGAI